MSDNPFNKLTRKKKPSELFSQLSEQTSEGTEQKTRSRSGKRSNPDYTQAGVYLPKKLLKRVKARLIETDQDLSELVADLLNKWLDDEPLNR